MDRSYSALFKDKAEIKFFHAANITNHVLAFSIGGLPSGPQTGFTKFDIFPRAAVVQVRRLCPFLAPSSMIVIAYTQIALFPVDTDTRLVRAP